MLRIVTQINRWVTGQQSDGIGNGKPLRFIRPLKEELYKREKFFSANRLGNPAIHHLTECPV